MSKFEDYADKYSRIRMERDDGILEVTLHTDGGTLVFGPEAHEQLPPAFLDISQDPDNRIVILTGAGDSFIEEVETATLKGDAGGGKPPAELDQDGPAHVGPHLHQRQDNAGQPTEHRSARDRSGQWSG